MKTLVMKYYWGTFEDSVYFIRETPCSLCCALASPTVLHLKNFAKSF